MAPGRGYRHLCEIAAGGMGRVYVAVRRDDPEMRLFAVKRLHPHLRDDARAIRRNSRAIPAQPARHISRRRTRSPQGTRRATRTSG